MGRYYAYSEHVRYVSKCFDVLRGSIHDLRGRIFLSMLKT